MMDQAIGNDNSLHGTRQTAAFLGIGRRGLIRRVQSRVIRAKRVGIRLYFKGSEIHRYINSLPDAVRQRRKGNG